MEQMKNFVAIMLEKIIKVNQFVRRMIYTMANRLLVNKCGKGVLFFEKTRIKGGRNVKIGSNVIIRRGCTIAAQTEYYGQKLHSSIVLGDGVDLGEECFITSTNEIVIGRNCLFGRLVTITDNSHGSTERQELLVPPHERKVVSKGGVYIGENVWIGDKVTVLSNVHIGDGTVIGANSVVTKDVPPYSVYGGIPAKNIRRVKSENLISDNTVDNISTLQES